MLPIQTANFTVTAIDKSATNKKTRIYVFHNGETLLENFVERRARPQAAYRAGVLPELKARGFLPADAKVSWSQKAGCGCGCSPGFIVDKYLGLDFKVSLETKKK